jgi:uncharacterized membrane protein YidH (DUF202 family)
MQPQEVFGIIVRSFGLLLAFYGVWNFIFGLMRAISLLDNADTSKPRPSAKVYLITALLFCIVGILLLTKAQVVIQMAY